MSFLTYPLIGVITIIKLTISIIYHFIYGIIVILTIIPFHFIEGIIYIFSKKKRKELKIENKIIPTIITTLSLITYLISIFILTRWYVQNERNKKFTESIQETTENINEPTENNTPQDIKKTTSDTDTTKYPDDLSFLNVNLDPYIQKNSETVAWIQVNGTNISYPVVKHSDNSYYLTHDFYQRKTDVGWVFADYRDEFDPFNNNTIIYGHNLINRTMFGQLPYLLKNKWQSNPNNYYIKLSTKKTNSIWQIFSVYKTAPTTEYLQSKFNSITYYQNFLNKLKNKSSFNFNTDINENDKIITLSTCDDTGTKRVAIHAKLIKIETKN